MRLCGNGGGDLSPPVPLQSLSRMICHQRMMRAIILLVYLGLGGVAPKFTGFGEESGLGYL